MFRDAPLLAFSLVLFTASVHAQVGPLGPSGDFRIDGRPGIAPTGGLAGGPSLPPGPAAFRDSLGGKSPDEILKEINQSLGKSSLERSDSMSGMRSIEVGKELQSPSDTVFK